MNLGYSASGQFDCIVIGGDFKGLLIAAVAVKKGKRVLLLEKGDKLCKFPLFVPFHSLGISPFLSKNVDIFSDIFPSSVFSLIQPEMQSRISAGKMLDFGSNLRGFEKFLKKKFPSDVDEIGKFFFDIKGVLPNFCDAFVSKMNGGNIRLTETLPFVKDVSILLSVAEYIAKKIKNPHLKMFLEKDLWLFGSPLEDLPFAIYAANLFVNDGDGVFSEEGRSQLCDSLVKFVQSNCDIRLQTKAKHLIFDGDSVVGVECLDFNGSTIQFSSPSVISVLDAFDTYGSLVMDRVNDDNFSFQEFDVVKNNSSLYRVSCKLSKNFADFGFLDGRNIVYSRNRDDFGMFRISEKNLLLDNINLADQIIVYVDAAKPNEVDVFLYSSGGAGVLFNQYLFNNSKKEVFDDLCRVLDSSALGFSSCIEFFKFSEDEGADFDSVRTVTSLLKDRAFKPFEDVGSIGIKMSDSVDYNDEIEKLPLDIGDVVYNFPLRKEAFLSRFSSVRAGFDGFYYCGNRFFVPTLSGMMLNVAMFSALVFDGLDEGAVAKLLVDLLKNGNANMNG